ncbi:MAG: helix-turn-helix domain-containing protein [Propionibacteriaceae bacterium]
MDNRDEVKAFLSSRRAKITPEQAGLHSYNRNRRVPGLRRSEVADLAGVSVEYYAQLERGNLAGVSDSVLDALARALQLDEAERAHLAELARTAGRAARITRRRTPPARQVRPAVARILDGMTEVPALVNNGRLDVVAANRLARALFAPMFADPSVSASRPANHARFNFLDPHARDFWLNWEATADETVAILRAEAGRDPYDKALTDLVGELCTRSDDFRVRWAAHDVRLHRTGLKHIHHPVVGDLHLSYEVMELLADPGLALTAFSAGTGSTDDDGLKLLASWAATHDPADALATPKQP